MPVKILFLFYHMFESAKINQDFFLDLDLGFSEEPSSSAAAVRLFRIL